MDGGPIPQEILIKALNTAGLAPSSWGKASKVAYTYFHSKMLNEPEFEFFRYCEGNWKITRWATKAYASWKCNHLDDRKTPCANKQKHKLLDDPTLLQIGNEPTEDMAMSITGCTAVKNCGSPSHIQLESDSDVMRQAITFADPLDSDDLYDEVDKNDTCGTTGPSTISEGDSAVSATTNSSTVPSVFTTPAAAATSSIPPTSAAAKPSILPTPAVSEEDNGQTCPQGSDSTSEPSMTEMTLAGTTHGLSSTSSPPDLEQAPTATIDNTEEAGQSRTSAKRAKLGPAVVGKGLTDKNFCMKEWLEQNPNSSKDTFESYFKALTQDVKKKYRDLAAAAHKMSRKEKKNCIDMPAAQ
ncbi:hypothetical protein DFH94DRAFT_699348 [Russula ochroleuca]|uniref:Uncharacterized protein n=1 Tax=Russula ochroleuca TaxID=152965 RepID=A0A9P5JVN3_9AGAM|nr:hypothetical protein DFH94DRAFT_699348 [Russula ochroleuca]